MKVIAKGRQKGKTTQLLYTSATTGYPILTPTESKCEFLNLEAKKLEIEIPEPITVGRLISSRDGGKPRNKILVDDTEEVLHLLLMYFGYDLQALTVTI